MKKIALLIAISIIISSSVKAQVKEKPDTLYTLKEKEVILLINLLNAGDQAISTSDNFSKNQWKEFHNAALKLDSIFTVQYKKYHPVKIEPKKP